VAGLGSVYRGTWLAVLPRAARERTPATLRVVVNTLRDVSEDQVFRDLFVELYAVYDLARNAMLKATHQPVGPIAHGWFMRCRRSLESH
jgi:hypothetical protein